MAKSKIGALLASTAVMGISMTPVERQMGRLMRAPDHPTPTPAPAGARDPIEDMMEDGGVEGQWSGDEEQTKKAAPKKAAAAEEAVDGGDDDEEDDADEGAESDDETDEEGDESEEAGKPKKGKLSAKERIQQLNRQLRESERGRAADRQEFEARFERLEKGLPADEKSSKQPAEAVAPDPTDTEKYPLGRLDDRYIDDQLEYLAEKKANEKLNGLLQREQENDQQAENDRIIADLTQKADTLAEKGAELFDDFDEVVVAAKAGKFPLTQETFEACVDAHHGAAILRDLHLDVKEAERVAAMSPYQQLRYVIDKDAEKGGKPKPKLPKAGAPPADAPRGARGKFEVPDDTDDLEAFGRKFDKA